MKKMFLISVLFSIALTGVTLTSTAQKNSTVLNHFALYVKDLAVSTAFYKNIVRLDSIPEPFHDGRHTWFRVGPHSQVHLISGAKEVMEHDKNTHLCFSVVSLEEFIARLEKENIWYTNWAGDGKTPTVRTDGVKQIYFKDPDGFWIEINDDKY